MFCSVLCFFSFCLVLCLPSFFSRVSTIASSFSAIAMSGMSVLLLPGVWSGPQQIKLRIPGFWLQ